MERENDEKTVETEVEKIILEYIPEVPFCGAFHYNVNVVFKNGHRLTVEVSDEELYRQKRTPVNYAGVTLFYKGKISREVMLMLIEL